MTLGPIEPVAVDRGTDAAEYAYQVLRRAVLMGHLAPGTVLSQVTLALELGISRTPLREAVSRLAGEGLVTNDFNRRMRVSELDLDDVDQIYAARIALEPVGVRTTVPRLDHERHGELAAHVAGMDRAIETGDMERFRADHRAFHLGLTSLVGARFSRMLAELWDHSERYRLAYLHGNSKHTDEALDERLRLSQVEHKVILAAARAGDADECAQHLVAHLMRTLDGVWAEMAEVPRPRVAPHAREAAKPRLGSV
jgi:DNA-binding GntR family transcriptional regulator